MQVFTVFLALMASLVLAGPIGRYRNPAVRPRSVLQAAPYANTTSANKTPVSTSSGIPGENMIILTSTDSTPPRPFPSAITQSRSFEDINDTTNTKTAAPLSTVTPSPAVAPTALASSAVVASSTAITSTKIVESPVQTTQASIPSDTSKITSSTSQKSFEQIGDVQSSSTAAPDKTTTTFIIITSSTSDAVVTPPTSSPASSISTATSPIATGSTSDAVVYPSSTFVPTTSKPTSALFSSVRFPVGTQKSTTTSVSVVSSANVSAPVPVPTSVALTTSASTVTPEPVVTSSPTISVKPTTTTSTGLDPSTSAVPGNGTSGDVGDKFGNRALAIAENKKFAAMTLSSPCDPNDPKTLNACINGGWARCIGGVYVSFGCVAPYKCLSAPLELSAGTSVGCITPEDVAFRMGLGSAAELDSLIAGGSQNNGSSTGLAPREMTVAYVPVETAVTVTPTPQEPVLPLPTHLVSIVHSNALAHGSVEATATVTPTPQEPVLPLPTHLMSTMHISTIPHAPAETVVAVTPISQEPVLPLPTYLLSLVHSSVLPHGSVETAVTVTPTPQEPVLPLPTHLVSIVHTSAPTPPCNSTKVEG